MEEFDFWKFFAGLGIFLFGMNELERALQLLGGRTFKSFLKRSTQSPLKAILTGTFATAVLQSSSVVTLMLLAFVGAGIISFQNAVGVIFGANLGTTLTGWIVAVFGFSFKIESFALPMIAFGALGQMFSSHKEKLNSAFRLLTGFGFLFLGLDFMKTSIDYLAETVDIAEYLVYGNLAFLAFGLVFTALVQSSSATMVITLSALNAGVIPFSTAGSIIIGANLGTTITVLLGSIQGHAAKRRVAVAHLMFNLVTATIAFPLLNGMVWFITDVLDLENKLFALTAFHTIFNFMGILVFFPFVKPFSHRLEDWIKEDVHPIAQFIHLFPPNEPEAGLVGLEKECQHMMRMVVHLNMLALNLRTDFGSREDEFEKLVKAKWKDKKSFMLLYQDIHNLELEMIHFYSALQKGKLSDAEAKKLSAIMGSIRNMIYSSKSMKDILHNLAELDNQDVKELEERFKEIRNFSKEFFRNFSKLQEEENQVLLRDGLKSMMELSRNFYNNFVATMYAKAAAETLDEQQVSTLLRVNREIYNSNKFLVRAALALLFPAEELVPMEEHPDFR